MNLEIPSNDPNSTIIPALHSLDKMVIEKDNITYNGKWINGSVLYLKVGKTESGSFGSKAEPSGIVLRTTTTKNIW